MASQKTKRILSNEDILKYEPMVEKFIRDSVVKNWSEARTRDAEVFLGSSGYSLSDFRQYLRTEVCEALYNYDPNFLSNGRPVKESTFVFRHLSFRIGQMMKRLTKRRYGYGVRHNQFDVIMQSGTGEHSVIDIDLANALDARSQLEEKDKTPVQRFLERKTHY